MKPMRNTERYEINFDVGLLRSFLITKKSEYASTMPDNIVTKPRLSRRYSVHSRVRMAIGQTAFSRVLPRTSIYIDSAIEISIPKANSAG